MSHTDETVTTWADGFGRWHARITFPDPGYGPGYLAANNARIRAKARRAIRREILARQTGPITSVRVAVTDNRVDHHNRALFVVYGEQ